MCQSIALSRRNWMVCVLALNFAGATTGRNVLSGPHANLDVMIPIKVYEGGAGLVLHVCGGVDRRASHGVLQVRSVHVVSP